MHHSEVRARELLKRLGTGPLHGAEIGVHQGEMANHVLRLHPGVHLLMVDNWLPREAQPGPYRASRDKCAQLNRAQQTEAKARALRNTAHAEARRRILHMASLDAAQTVPDGSLDFVFIDADHSYEGVRADIAAWLPKVRAGGLFSGHDYSPPGKYSAKGWPGVVRAIHEAVDAHGWTLDLGENATWFVRLP